MKTLGLIGGLSYHSTAVYYNLINQQINEISGGNNTAKMLLYSVNYNDFKELQTKNDWDGIETMLSDIAIKLEQAGADCILISCNAAHLIADSLIKKINVPFIHIAESTANEISNNRLTKVALIGTKFVMENSFFTDRLTDAGIETIIPNTNERELIQTAILDELSQGKLSIESKVMFQSVIQNLKVQGAEAVVFGCTEIGMFISQSDCELQIFDTTIIHAKAAVDFAISGKLNSGIEQIFEIKSLAEISFDEIFETYLKAFKDYPFKWSKEGLKKTIHRRGYDAAISFGAFYKNELVSFTLNGIGSFNNLKTVYDTGTGTVEEHRGKGLASRIFEYSIPFLKAKGVQQYILEVLEDNTKAISVYSKQGFTGSRKFDCFRITSEDWKLQTANYPGVELKEINFSFQSQMETMIDFNLSWQNNFEALKMKPNDFIIIGAFHNNDFVGYGILEPETGDIPQLAVTKNFRKKGIGTMLLNKLKKTNRAEIVKAVNIESNQEAIISFLIKNGIPKIVSQLEMIKSF